MGWGMGETVKIDDRWRIVIPRKFRRGLKPRDELIVEKRGSEIILKKAQNKDLVKEFEEIKLYAPEDRIVLNAERGKHKYGGRKL